jgi:hypothetical protein
VGVLDLLEWPAAA